MSKISKAPYGLQSVAPAAPGTDQMILFPKVDRVFYTEDEDGILRAVYTQRLITANSGAAYAVDLSLANIFHITLTANCTFTFINVPDICDFTLFLDQDGTGGWSSTLPTALYNGGAAPTLDTTASNKSILTFLTLNGGATWYGALVGDGFA